MYNVVDDFALVSSGGRYFGGAWAILKKEGEKWGNMFGWYQDLWECDKLLKADVPPSLLEIGKESIGDECYSADGERDYRQFYQEKI